MLRKLRFACNAYRRRHRTKSGTGKAGFTCFAGATGHTSTSKGRTMFRSILLRLVLPIAFASCVVAYFGLPYIERLLAEWFRSDVELRAQLVMHSMEEQITDLVEKRQRGAAASLPREDNCRPAPARHPGVPYRRLDDLQDRAHARNNFLRLGERREALRGAGRAIAVRLRSSVALRFRRGPAEVVSRADAA